MSSMSDRACLVTLEIKSPGFRKTTKRGSAELASQNDAENDRIAASVALLPRECLSRLTKATSAARKLVEGVSAPWAGKAGVMPIAETSKLRNEFDKLKAEHTAAKYELGAKYNDLVSQSAPALGTFAADFQFPSWAAVEKKISMELNFLPLPGGESDWRIAMQEEERALMQSGIEAANREMVEANRQRARDALNDMLERVSAYRLVQDDTTKTGERIEGAFHQSALDQLRQTADILRSLNFLGDTEFADICDDMERIGKMKAAELKASQAFRDSALEEAKALTERLA